MLHLSLGRSHGRGLRRAWNRVEFRFLRPAVDKNKADIGLVGCHRAHARVQIDVVVDGHIVVAVGSTAHVLLAEDRVNVSVLESSIVVQLADEKLRVVELIHPLGNVLLGVPFTFAGNGID